MENFILIYPQIIQQIFEQLDSKNLVNCREVAKSWQDHIDNQNLTWIRIVEIPTVLQHEDTYLHVAAKTGQTEIFEMILEEEESKNPRNRYGVTPFHQICRNGSLQLAELIVQESYELNIQLNSKDGSGRTAFHDACRNGQSEIVEMLIEKSREINIEPNTKDKYGLTAFHLACLNENDDPKVVEMIIEKSKELNVDLNSKDNDGMTAFHLACLHAQLR